MYKNHLWVHICWPELHKGLVLGREPLSILSYQIKVTPMDCNFSVLGLAIYQPSPIFYLYGGFIIDLSYFLNKQNIKIRYLRLCQQEIMIGKI